METVVPNIIQPDNHIQLAIVNGLISTIILWIFWTPFILKIAVPLVGAQVKNSLCRGLRYLPSLPNSNPVVSENLLENNLQDIENINSGLTIIFIVVSVIIISFCMYGVYTVVDKYNLSYGKILLFNFVMAIIIVLIETSFFIGVTIKYSAFVPTELVNDLTNQIGSYFNSLTENNTNTPLPPANVQLYPASPDLSSFLITWSPPPTTAVPSSYIVYLWSGCENGQWVNANIANNVTGTNITLQAPSCGASPPVSYQTTVQSVYSDGSQYTGNYAFFPWT